MERYALFMFPLNVFLISDIFSLYGEILLRVEIAVTFKVLK